LFNGVETRHLILVPALRSCRAARERQLPTEAQLMQWYHSLTVTGYDVCRSALKWDGRAKGTGIQATNDFRRLGYGGLCPPHRHGPHRYHFRLLAPSIDHLPFGNDPSCGGSNEKRASISSPRRFSPECMSDDGLRSCELWQIEEGLRVNAAIG
jgi:hypothetical protein